MLDEGFLGIAEGGKDKGEVRRNHLILGIMLRANRLNPILVTLRDG
jgi:hypothetical protein